VWQVIACGCSSGGSRQADVSQHQSGRITPDEQPPEGLYQGAVILTHGSGSPHLGITSRHTLAAATYTNRQGRFTDRSLESQKYRASGLNLLIAAISH
jgi:hypothetical protein